MNDEVKTEETMPAVVNEVEGVVIDADEYNERLIAYHGEIQLIENKWSDVSGYVTRMQLHESDEGGHPLKTYHRGTRFHLVLVEVDDDEQPIDQMTKQRINKHLTNMQKGGRYSKEAGMLCRDPQFQRYLYRLGKIDPTWDEKMRTEAARHYVCQVCNIESRKELDHDEHKAQAFRNNVTGPFLDFGRKHPEALRGKHG